MWTGDTMRKPFCTLGRLWLAGLCALFGGTVLAGHELEQLDYQVSYRGMLSLGQDVQIADVSLQTRRLGDAPGLRALSLEASSAAYPAVESVYPIRYRFRTWLSGDGTQLVGFETNEKGQKVRHRLYLRDASALGVKRLEMQDGAARRAIAQLDAGENPTDVAGKDRLLDRLGLLQRVRRQQLAPGAEFRFAVTNGRHPLVYRVVVEAAQTLEFGGHAVPAWKLRFDGSRIRDDGAEEPSHRPVYIWLSRAPAHVPLRAESRHAVGLFRVELKQAAALNRMAGLDP
jgi:hypothetical protein